MPSVPFFATSPLHRQKYMNAVEIALLVCSLVVVYTYLLYPLAIGFIAKGRRRVHIHPPYTPNISILVIAHNEASCIRRRIENILALDYDQAKLEVVIASDGSSDDTALIASDYKDRGIKVIEFSENQGKPAVLDQVVPTLGGDIVVLLDARQTLKADSLQLIVQDFSEPTVGAISGELIFTESAEALPSLEGVGLYWRYEKYIRLNESHIDSTIGATGAFYAIRRKLFEAIPEITLIDDVLIPMQITRRGYRVLFKPDAIVYDVAPSDPAAEFTRKVRTIAGNFQLFHQHSWLLNPLQNRLWLQTLSHKVLRLFIPLFLVAIFLLNAMLLNITLYNALFTLQLLFYGAALVAYLKPSLRSRYSILSLPYTFCLLNWATAVGFYRYALGQQGVTWHQHRQRT